MKRCDPLCDESKFHNTNKKSRLVQMENQMKDQMEDEMEFEVIFQCCLCFVVFSSSIADITGTIRKQNIQNIQNDTSILSMIYCTKIIVEEKSSFAWLQIIHLTDCDNWFVNEFSCIIHQTETRLTWLKCFANETGQTNEEEKLAAKWNGHLRWFKWVCYSNWNGFILFEMLIICTRQLKLLPRHNINKHT